ncbi:transglycosylase-like protein with SLT domain [Sinobacterium caligoides]|uniref:Transglycosylase-like protein with SLT domain n=1 Tax=Sinobacterium caligoides TaxID=933926 RepID=A0A3N2D4L1_9GAMM|nr:lytic transglycosylase domain-containing protein [Sinobacterium caligoides]ROR94736.1 transglycosylase-like protein with SLT domain [Sinobacterium caligoides]
MLRRIIITATLLLSGAVFSATPPAEEHEALSRFLKQSLHNAHSFEDKFDAEVWLMTMQQPLSRYIKDPAERIDLLKKVHAEATRAGVPPDLVLALIEIESHFKRFAISRVGAQGMMQVMPFWKNEIGRADDNLTSIDTNLRYGCTILKFYIDREKGRLAPALARYNGSYGRRIYSDKVLAVWNRHWYGPPF